MIHVSRAEEPRAFHAAVREPGLRALAELVGEKPLPPRATGRSFKKIADRKQNIPSERLPTYWTKALDDLMEAYRQICAYSCFRIHPVTDSRSVDHMAARSRAWDRVYEWSNARIRTFRERDYLG